MNILIIGGSGFIGKNLLTTISERENINVSTISYQLEEDEIIKNIKGMEFIVHLAGVNRSKNSNDFYEGNVNITEKICNANIRYFKEEILQVDPFEEIDRKGVGRLMRMAVKDARAVKSKISIGICGEHGGEPKSIEFCKILGLDYVSCSPYRVPVARLAAAQVEL